MKNLGKILILIYLIPLSLIANAPASVTASVDSPNVERGEMVTYELMLNGDNIVRPTILTLCGENVISTGSQTSIQMINGTMTKSYILSYKFLPKTSCVINPIEVEIDSKIIRTNSVNVNVSKLKIKKNSPFILTLLSDKKQVYVGEEFNMTLLFKQRDKAEAIDSEFIAPTFKGFWIKGETKSKRYKKDGYTVTEKNYVLAPQRVGELKISAAEMRIAYRTHTKDPWAGIISRIKWRSYYSNELSIGVKTIPNGLSLVGDFSISAEIDKNSIKPNEAVNVNIRVLGKGNLEDIESFKPSIDGVNVFDEKITIVDGVLMQKMAFVSDRDFKVPSFQLKYFNPNTNEIKTIQTKAFSINVKNSKKTQDILKIKKDETSLKNKAANSDGDVLVSFINGIIPFLVGILVGILLSLLRPFRRRQKEKVFNTKDEKVLFMKLLPYNDDSEVQGVLDKLEFNLYSDTKKVIDKKILKELIMRYKIS